MGNIFHLLARKGRFCGPRRGGPPFPASPKLVPTQGGGVVLSVNNCMEEHQRGDLDRGPHQSTMAPVPFLWEDFASMIGKVKWVILSYFVDNYLPELRLIPQGLK